MIRLHLLRGDNSNTLTVRNLNCQAAITAPSSLESDVIVRLAQAMMQQCMCHDSRDALGLEILPKGRGHKRHFAALGDLSHAEDSPEVDGAESNRGQQLRRARTFQSDSSPGLSEHDLAPMLGHPQQPALAVPSQAPQAARVVPINAASVDLQDDKASNPTYIPTNSFQKHTHKCSGRSCKLIVSPGNNRLQLIPDLFYLRFCFLFPPKHIGRS